MMSKKEAQLRRRLRIVEADLEKNRATVLVDGWQTQRFAKKSRKWDVLAIEKFELIEKLEQFDHEPS
jgi:allantoicase